jgi:hypothetical protein
MSVLLEDESLRITVFYDRAAPRVDSICLYLEETCPAAVKLLREGEAALHLTVGQARALADELLAAIKEQAFRG